MGKVVSQEKASIIREKLRAEGKVVVFTNGCFDLLHVGHVRCLRQAKELGDVLIVGLNSDASMRKFKDSSRPLVPQAERAEILAALEAVDHIVLFDEATAERLVAAIQPDIYVKGGDYAQETRRRLPEAKVVEEYGGQVHILPYVPGRSTTEVIEMIIERYGEGK